MIVVTRSRLGSTIIVFQYCLRCRLEEAPSDDCFLKQIILISPVFGAAMTIDAQDIWILLSEGVSDYFHMECKFDV